MEIARGFFCDFPNIEKSSRRLLDISAALRINVRTVKRGSTICLECCETSPERFGGYLDRPSRSNSVERFDQPDCGA